MLYCYFKGLQICCFKLKSVTSWSLNKNNSVKTTTFYSNVRNYKTLTKARSLSKYIDGTKIDDFGWKMLMLPKQRWQTTWSLSILKPFKKSITALKVCEVLIDSFAGVLVHQYLFLPRNSYMVLYDTHKVSRIPLRILLVPRRF